MWSYRSSDLPTDACQWFYECKGCGILLKPKQVIVVCFVPMVQFHVHQFNKRLLTLVANHKYKLGTEMKVVNIH